MTENSSTLQDAIRRPNNPQHMFILKPIAQRVRIHAADTLVADSLNAVYLLESFNKAYDPMIYVPQTDITANLERIEKTTHCPLKGDEIGWAYNSPFDFSQAIKGFHAGQSGEKGRDISCEY